MPRQTLIFLCACSLCFTVFSCNKTDSKPHSSTPPPAVGTMNINLTFAISSIQYELIISEPGGIVLLDTMAGNQPVIAALKTNDTLVDVTTVVTEGNGHYLITTFKSINAATFTGLYTYGYIMAYSLKTQGTTAAKIFYKNIPAGILNYDIAPQIFFTNYPYNEGSTVTDPLNNDVSLSYQNYAGNYAYFLLPSVGLYSLHMQTSPSDTVDCSHLDTAISLTFNRPQPFTVSSLYSSFIGIPDTTDFTKIIAFTDPILAAPSRPGVDLEYPKVPVQKYELYVNATNASNDAVGYYCYSDSVPLTLPLLQESDYVITSTQNNNFSVTFPGVKPSYYLTVWTDSAISLVIYGPPDSGTLHPLTLMANQNSKLLQGISVNSLALKGFEIENVNGMPYRSYIPYITNSATI